MDLIIAMGGIIAVLLTGIGLLFRKNSKDAQQHEKEMQIKETQIETRNQEIARREAAEKAKVKENEKTKEVGDSVNRLDSGSAGDRLRNEWNRD